MRSLLKRPSILLICVLSSVLLIAAIVSCFGQDKVTYENFEKIRAGMSERQVEAILGSSGEVYFAMQPVTRRWLPSNRRWIGNGVKIELGLDMNGHVTGKYFGESAPRPFLGWLKEKIVSARGRLGLY
jgi:hypothetical protein